MDNHTQKIQRRRPEEKPRPAYTVMALNNGAYLGSNEMGKLQKECRKAGITLVLQKYPQDITTDIAPLVDSVKNHEPLIDAVMMLNCPVDEKPHREAVMALTKAFKGLRPVILCSSDSNHKHHIQPIEHVGARFYDLNSVAPAQIAYAIAQSVNKCRSGRTQAMWQSRLRGDSPQAHSGPDKAFIITADYRNALHLRDTIGEQGVQAVYSQCASPTLNDTAKIFAEIKKHKPKTVVIHHFDFTKKNSQELCAALMKECKAQLLPVIICDAQMQMDTHNRRRQINGVTCIGAEGTPEHIAYEVSKAVTAQQAIRR